MQQQHATGAHGRGELGEHRDKRIRAQVLDHGERVGDVSGTGRGTELGWRQVGDVGQVVQHPGAGQHTAGDVDRVDVRGPPRHRGREVPGTAPVVDDSRAGRQVRRDQLVGQDLAGHPVPGVFRGQVTVVEIVRGKGEEAQSDILASRLRRVGDDPLDPAGAEKVLAAAPGSVTDQHVRRDAREPLH